MKIAGILMLISATSLLGFNEAWKLKKRAAFLNEIKKYITFFTNELRYSLYPPNVILKKYAAFSRHPIFGACQSRMESEPVFRKAWEDTLISEGKQYALTSADKALLIAFGEGLGTSDLTGQLAHCGLYEGYLENLCNEAAEANRHKSKLYRILGITAGAAASVLLI